METFCAQFWTALDITPREGFVRPCCVFKLELENEKPPLVSNSTFDEAINSETFIEWRRKILAGKTVAGCQHCYTKERDGSVSDRIVYNRAYEAVYGKNPKEVFVEPNPPKLRPLALSLHLGNMCNLKCRMCGPQASSSIASDSLHRGWAVRGFKLSGEGNYKQSWLTNHQQLIDRISQVADSLVHLHVSGGEPLIMSNTRKLFEHLVEANNAPNIHLYMPSNGTKIDDKVLSLLSQFKTTNIRLSVDGYQLADEYIRYPSKWNEVMTNIAKLRTLPNVRLSVGFTLSAYNIFEPVKVSRWAIAEGMRFEYGFVENPYFLNPAILPSKILKGAASNIFAFLDEQDLSETDFIKNYSLNQLKGIANYLKQLSHRHAQGHLTDEFYEFMAFTDELDRGREQRFSEACPELWKTIGSEKGMNFTTVKEIVRLSRAKPLIPSAPSSLPAVAQVLN